MILCDIDTANKKNEKITKKARGVLDVTSTAANTEIISIV
jgi:hypothetical protein